MPMYRSALHQRPQQTQHHPTCRCSDCHLKVDLFPRNERGTILLPHPSWIKPLGHADDALILENRRWSVGHGQIQDKGKGKEAVEVRSRSQSISRLEGPGQPRSPSWQHRLAAEQSRMASPSHASTSTLPPTSSVHSHSQDHTPQFNMKLPQIQASSNLSGPSQLSQRYPQFSNPHSSPSASYPPPTDRSSRPSNKRKASELQDSPKHVAHPSHPLPPPTNCGDAQGPHHIGRVVRRRTANEDNEPQRGTESRGLPYQSHASAGPSPRSQPGMELSFNSGHGPSRRGSLPLSDRASPTVPSLGPGLSAPVNGTRFVPPAQLPSGVATTTAEPSLIRFSIRPENFQPEGVITTTRMTQTKRRSADSMPVADDTQNGRGTDGEGYEDRDSNASGSEVSSRSSSVNRTRSQANPIRFREPLTEKSRQDRKVVKGGIAIVQVKWDSDRKRRQGYFAPDNGAEKSPFRHYSKDDCCFDD
ncbi:hypothetical protein CC2G_004212 [Coprinopsis cinerea AmutBmut pab1-1]|nr:hypothetical protein CC2G_004212 [Coprinopsis cinerea AmutBmut pab1-1]